MAVCDVVAVLAVAVAVYMVVHAWAELPDRIPVHFNGRGVPDSWGGKGSLLIGPVIAITTGLLLTIVNHFPHTFNYLHTITEENAQAHYRLAREMMAMLRAAIAVLGAVMSWMQIEAARTGSTTAGSVGLVVATTVAVPFAALLIYFVRASRVDNRGASAVTGTGRR
jgi:uncharacterized membrane protein